MHSFISWSWCEENQSEINMIQIIPRDKSGTYKNLTWVYHKTSHTSTERNTIIIGSMTVTLGI